MSSICLLASLFFLFLQPVESIREDEGQAADYDRVDTELQQRVALAEEEEKSKSAKEDI